MEWKNIKQINGFSFEFDLCVGSCQRRCRLRAYRAGAVWGDSHDQVILDISGKEHYLWDEERWNEVSYFDRNLGDQDPFEKWFDVIDNYSWYGDWAPDLGCNSFSFWQEAIVQYEDRLLVPIKLQLSTHELCNFAFCGGYNKVDCGNSDDAFWCYVTKGTCRNGPEQTITVQGGKESDTAGFVYVLKADNGVYKIGKTVNLEQRIPQLAVSLPYELELICVIKTDDKDQLELDLHNHFADRHLGKPRTEWFELTETDVEYLKELANDY